MFKVLMRIRLVWWAILGRPIIYSVEFNGGVKLTKRNRNVFIARNIFLG